MLVHGVDCKVPTFKLCPTIVETLDPTRAQLEILPKVLLVHDICSFYHFSIQQLGTLEMNEVCNELCVDDILKLEHNHLETKVLTHILHMPKDCHVKWIRFVLS